MYNYKYITHIKSVRNYTLAIEHLHKLKLKKKLIVLEEIKKYKNVFKNTEVFAVKCNLN